MGHRRRAEAGEREPERSTPSHGQEVRPASGSDLHPVLGLQATAGNAAVTALLRRAGGPNVQRLWDTDDETGDPDPGQTAESTQADDSTTGPAADDSTTGPAADAGSGTAQSDGGAPDPVAIDAIQSEVEAELDPATVIGTLAPYASTDEGLGDYETPNPGETAQALAIQRDPPGPDAPATRPGSPGDVLKALMPYLQPALDQLKANVLAALARLKLGEKIAVAVVVAPIALGPLTQPGPRGFALDQLNGTDVTFGVIPNLKVMPNIGDGKLRGGMVTYDLAPALRGLGLPF